MTNAFTYTAADTQNDAEYVLEANDDITIQVSGRSFIVNEFTEDGFLNVHPAKKTLSESQELAISLNA